jgi:rhomboid family GlyGly-CTERM serine protease
MGVATGRRYLLLLVAGIGVVALYATLQAEPAGAVWRYDRSAVLAGEWGRLFTAHLVHGSILHWALNMAGLGLAMAIFPDDLTVRRLAVILPPLALAVAGGLLLLNPEVYWYVGFSGVLHGVLMLGVVRDLLGGSRLHVITLAALCAKLVYEQTAGPAVATVAMIGLPVIVDAHLYGAAAGVVVALISHDRAIAAVARLSGYGTRPLTRARLRTYRIPPVNHRKLSSTSSRP